MAVQFRRLILFACFLPLCTVHRSTADVGLPTIISDGMVLQRDVRIPIWGWAEPGEEVTVSIADQTHNTKTNESGRWQVNLDPLQVGPPLEMKVKGDSELEVKDILVGEVWICSGQSNMQWAVSQSWNADLESKAANYPNIRLITVNTPGVQKPLEDFVGKWERASSTTIGGFSAVGYHFGKQLHLTLDVPIGLIDNAWGGSSCEAWVRRELLDDIEIYKPLLERWAETEAKPENVAVSGPFEQKMATWWEDNLKAKKAGKSSPPFPKWPGGPMHTQHRPGNLFHGRLKPIFPYSVRGAIWYQGESNAGRAFQYRQLFPLMIENWREEWESDMSFYWVQLADFMAESTEPGESAWAELREAQTMTLKKLPKTGEAVTIDLGEASDIHPRNKREVGLRLARWAMANDYGIKVDFRSPVYKSMSTEDGKAIVNFEHVGKGLRTVDAREVQGFAISGNDRNWFRAEAKIIDGDRIQVWSDKVLNPVAVRYAWANNPICNVYSKSGLPLTPFRSDDWEGVTDNNFR